MSSLVLQKRSPVTRKKIKKHNKLNWPVRLPANTEEPGKYNSNKWKNRCKIVAEMRDPAYNSTTQRTDEAIVCLDPKRAAYRLSHNPQVLASVPNATVTRLKSRAANSFTSKRGSLLNHLYSLKHYWSWSLLAQILWGIVSTRVLKWMGKKIFNFLCISQSMLNISKIDIFPKTNACLSFQSKDKQANCPVNLTAVDIEVLYLLHVYGSQKGL